MEGYHGGTSLWLRRGRNFDVLSLTPSRRRRLATQVAPGEQLSNFAARAPIEPADDECRKAPILRQCGVLISEMSSWELIPCDGLCWRPGALRSQNRNHFGTCRPDG
jgi:hypothetical protein